MSIDLRAVTAEEFPTFNRAEETAFGTATPSLARQVEELSVLELDRTIAAFDGDRIVGTAASFAFDMTVPGGATLPVAGVSSVTVSATHRRRGLLRRMMRHQLDDVVGRGEPVAVLNASESGIYGRFGYGLANLYAAYRIDTRRAHFRELLPERAHPLRIVDRDQARAELPPIYDRCRRLRPGMLSQSDAWWGCVLSDNNTWKGPDNLFVVVADADERAGSGPGYALYKVDADAPPGHWTLSVWDMQAADPVVEAQLWRYLLDVDLVETVVAAPRPADCPLRWWLADPRQARTTELRDYLFVRLLDVERALAARRYPVADELVVEVTDPFRPANDGCYRIRGGPDSASCERTTTAPADLALGIEELGSVYLGGVRPSHLAAAGRIVERRPGALARADAFFGWPVAPICVTRF